MIFYKPEIGDIMGFPSERSLNKGIIPVIKKPYKNPNFPFEFDYEKSDLTSFFGVNRKNTDCVFRVDNYWDHKTFMLFDSLTLKISNNIFNYRVPKSINYRIQKNGINDEELDNILVTNTSSNSESVLMDLEDIKQIPYFKTCSKNHIEELIFKLKNTRITLPYEARLYNCYTESFHHTEFKHLDFENMFNKIEKVGSKKYKFYFSSELSIIYFMNIAQLNIDFIDEVVYKLPRLSHLFYRKIILPHRGKIKKISLNDIKSKLNIDSNIYQTKKLVEKTLSDLYKNNLILDSNFEYKTVGNKNQSNLILRIIDPRYDTGSNISSDENF